MKLKLNKITFLIQLKSAKYNKRSSNILMKNVEKRDSEKRKEEHNKKEIVKAIEITNGKQMYQRDCKDVVLNDENKDIVVDFEEEEEEEEELNETFTPNECDDGNNVEDNSNTKFECVCDLPIEKNDDVEPLENESTNNVDAFQRKEEVKIVKREPPIQVPRNDNVVYQKILEPKIEVRTEHINDSIKKDVHRTESQINEFKKETKVNKNFAFGLIFLIIGGLVGIYSLIHSNPIQDNGFKKIENQLIFILNDCIYKRLSVAVNDDYSDDFIKYISFESDYIDIVNSSFVIKKEKKSFFCKALDFCDHNPNLSGIIILWFICFFLYLYNAVLNYQTRMLLPLIINILNEKKGKMCYIEDIKRKIINDGNNVFFTWRFLQNKIGKSENIITVKMVDEKPFWSLSK